MTITRRQFLMRTAAVAAVTVLPLDPGRRQIVGEIGRFEGFRFVEAAPTISSSVLSFDRLRRTVAMLKASNALPMDGWYTLHPSSQIKDLLQEWSARA